MSGAAPPSRWRCLGATALAILGWLPPADEVRGNESAPASLSLEACVELALARSPDLAGARERIEAARAETEIAGSEYAPRLSVSETYTASNNPPAAFTMTLNQRRLNLAQDFNRPDTTDNFNTRLGVEWRLYAGSRRRFGLRSAEAGEGRSRAAAGAVRNDLVHQVHRGFFGVLRAREMVRIQEAARSSLEISLETARKRLRAGTVVKTDVLNLEVRLAENGEELARARNREALARSALANLVGDPLPRTAVLRDPEIPSREEGIPAGLSAGGRPEIRAAEAAVAMREAQWRRARGRLRPAVDLVAHYDLDTEQFDDVEDSWFAGVAAQWELFDGSRRRGSIRRAEAELREAREAARRVRLDLEHQLQEAILGLREAVERVEVTSKSIESAEESLRVTRTRYENGAADVTELLGAEAAMTAARARATSALYDREVARSGLRRATGGYARDAGNPDGPAGREE